MNVMQEEHKGGAINSIERGTEQKIRTDSKIWDIKKSDMLYSGDDREQ
jgi:hypothetical protein